MLHYSRGVKRQQGFTQELHFMFIMLQVSFLRWFTMVMVLHDLVIIMPEIQVSDRSVVQGRFPGGNGMNCS